MRFRVIPADKIAGEIDLPASKSYSIRAIFVAACGGVSRLNGLSECDDALAALGAARSLGASIGKIPAGVEIRAALAETLKKNLKINVNESGTSLRFILPLLPFYSSSARVAGQGTLAGRPNHHLLETLRACGLHIQGQGAAGSVPIDFHGGTFRGGAVKIDGSLSSQFISALMIALPRSAEDTRLVMTGKQLVSQDYVTMTAQILERAGIRLVRRSAREFFIPGGQIFKGLKNFTVPSDYGLAAFLMAAAALVPSDLRLNGYFNDDLVQSDGAVLGFYTKMNVNFRRTRTCIHIKGPFSLKGGTFSLKDAPDLVPVMAVMAMFADGVTRLTNIGHARVKESDRISDLRNELLKVGADISEKPNELIIRPRAGYKKNVQLDSHRDHRLAMAFAVLGLRLGITVSDMECSAKSYPAFTRHFRSLTGAATLS